MVPGVPLFLLATVLATNLIVGLDTTMPAQLAYLWLPPVDTWLNPLRISGLLWVYTTLPAVRGSAKKRPSPNRDGLSVLIFSRG